MKRYLTNSIAAIVVGFALRLLFVFQFPVVAGDTIVYEELSENWLNHGVYELLVDDCLTPVDIRMPGYPAYLTVVYRLTGRTGAAARIWVMLGQVVLDLATCALIALLAVAVSSRKGKETRPLRARALWLAATCPFIANYAAVPLTEVFATFFTAAAMVFFVRLMESAGSAGIAPLSSTPRPPSFLARHGAELQGVFAALLVGLGTLFRPETPLLLFAPSAVLGLFLLPQGQAWRWIRTVVLMGVACSAPLLPWAVRNAVTFHEFRFLAPRYAEPPGALVPHGFIAWEKTWLWKFRDVYLVSWKLNEEPISLSDIPESAFDTAEEKQRVATVLSEYNDTTTITSEEDSQFAAIARERTARRPLRTYLRIPLARAASMWLTPRIELLPFSGHVFPLPRSLAEDPADVSVTIGFFLLNIFYLVLAGFGTVRLWRSSRTARHAILMLLGYLFLRTAFLSTLETPEPRYLVECIPILLALSAQAFGPAPERSGAAFPPPGECLSNSL
jgi:hypothetical protein